MESPWRNVTFAGDVPSRLRDSNVTRIEILTKKIELKEILKIFRIWFLKICYGQYSLSLVSP